MTSPTRVTERRRRTRNLLASVGLGLLGAAFALSLFGHRLLVPAIICLIPGLACFIWARFLGWRWL